jgi:hypothetical protein
MDPAHGEERRCSVTRLVTTLVFAGLVLTLSPAAAQLPESWTTVKVFAARWVDTDDNPTRVEILKGEAFHDTAIITNDPDEELEWKLNCVQFDSQGNPGTCGTNLEFAIVDFHFVADLDSIADNIASEVPGDAENVDFQEPVKLKRGKKWVTDFSPKFKNASSSLNKGKGQGNKAGQAFKSGVADSGFDGKSQLWKYTIVVEDPLSTSDCLSIKEDGEAELKNNCFCDDEALCDTWDPHVYTHGGRDY